MSYWTTTISLVDNEMQFEQRQNSLDIILLSHNEKSSYHSLFMAQNEQERPNLLPENFQGTFPRR